MNQHVRRLFHSCAAVAVLLTSIVSTVRAQYAGTISVRVIDATSNAPVASAQVQVVGTTRGAVTGDDGRYRIAGVRPGQYQVRALRLGYQASSQTVDVTSGGTATADFSLAAAAISLEQVVTTATGETERKREIGSAVSTLQPQPEQVASAQNVS